MLNFKLNMKIIKIYNNYLTIKRINKKIFFRTKMKYTNNKNLKIFYKIKTK